MVVTCSQLNLGVRQTILATGEKLGIMKVRLAARSFALCVACASCSGTKSTAPGATRSVAGTWHLATINGFQLPVDVPTDSGTFNIRQDSLMIAESGGWAETAIGYKYVNGGGLQTRVRSTVGTWTREGVTFTLRGTGGGVVYRGSSDGTQLKLTEPVTGFPFLFVHAIPTQ